MGPSVTLEESLSILLQRLRNFLNRRSPQAGREKRIPNIALTAKEFLSPILKLTGTSAYSDESGHLFRFVSDTDPTISDSCRSEATLVREQ